MALKHHCTLPDGTELVWDKGRIDAWCVYIVKDGKRRAPLDTEYFDYIMKLGERVGEDHTYAIFCSVWELAEKEPQDKASRVIDGLVALIPPAMRESGRLWFNVLYMGMVSEENYPNTKLGKRIKRLGVYQLLFENMSPFEAANWSKTKPWRELADECEQRGF